MQVWELNGPTLLWETDSPFYSDFSSIQAVSFSPDGRTLMVCGREPPNQAITQLDAATGQEIGEWQGRCRLDDEVTYGNFANVVMSPDGSKIAACGGRPGGGYAMVWDAGSREPLGRPMLHDKNVVEIEFSADAQSVFTVDGAGALREWNATVGLWKDEPLSFKTGGERIGSPYTLSPDGSVVVLETETGAVSDEGHEYQVELFDIKSGKAIGHPARLDEFHQPLSCSPNARTVLLGDGQRTALLWDVIDGEKVGVPIVAEDAIECAGFSGDGQLLVTVTESGVTQLWSGRTGASIAGPLIHDAKGEALSISFDGKRVLVGYSNDEAVLWDRSDKKAGQRFSVTQSKLRVVALSPDGQTALTAGDDKIALLWSFATAKPIGEPLPHDEAIASAAFSHDGRLVMTSCMWSGNAWLWDVETRKLRGETMRHSSVGPTPAHIAATSFTLDGHFAITGQSNGTVRVWEIAPPIPEDQERLRSYIAWKTGYTRDEDGTRLPVSKSDWLKLAKQQR